MNKMTPNQEMLLRGADYILVVNKDYEIVYNSRFDKKMGAKSSTKPYKNFFDMYPSLDRDGSSVVKTMSTGISIYNEEQEWRDINGKVYRTRNITIPIVRKGKIEGVIEFSKDLTTLGDIEDNKNGIEMRVDNKPVAMNRDGNDRIDFDDILTINDKMFNAIHQAKIFSNNSNPILICGETGTGKEMFAQAIINYMISGKQKVVVQNCAAVPENLIEVILFGTTKGAYTGSENKKGLFEEADGGYFFLDELNALPFAIQSKLLRVLQEGTFRPIGSSREKKVKVKVIAAMNIDPMEAIEKNILRKDLFYRLSSNMINLPPLRERPDDIEYLTDNYIDMFNEMYGKHVQGISEELRSFFLSYGWEGNVRELKHVIESMVSMTDGDMLELKDIPAYLNSKGSDKDSRRDTFSDDCDISVNLNADNLNIRDVVDKVERDLIIAVMKKCRNNKTKAGEILGIPRQTLKYKMDKLNIVCSDD